MRRYFAIKTDGKFVRVTGPSGIYVTDGGSSFSLDSFTHKFREISAAEFAVLRIKGWAVLVSTDLGSDDA